jgi:hypothetical protein
MTQSANRPSPKADRKRQSLLPSRLEKNLSAYAFAASSAGVAMLACALPTEAKIIATQTDISIPEFTTGVQLDLNNDGQFDFALSYVNFKSNNGARARHLGAPPLGSGSFDFGLRVTPLHAGNEVIQVGSHYGQNCAAAVPHGVTISPARRFEAGPMVLSGLSGTSEGRPFCNWSASNSPFLGVKFKDTTGQTHYGWIRIEIKTDYPRVIKGYAYETVPGNGIGAGIANGPVEEAGLDPLSAPFAEPASLGLLAQGAMGLTIWRREEESLAA